MSIRIRGSGELRGAQVTWMDGWMWLVLQANGRGWATKEAQASPSLLGEGGQRHVLTGYLKSPGTSSPRRTWWLCQPRASKGPFEHGRPAPGCLRPSFASPPRQGERSTVHAPLPAQLASVRPGLSHQAATRVPPTVGPVLPSATSLIKIQIPGSTPNPQNGVLWE